MREIPTLLHVAAAVRDAAGVDAQPGAVAVRDGRVVASGAVEDVRAEACGEVVELDHGAVLLLPAFVNSHAHLDLAGLGPRPFAGSFVDWVRMVVRERPREASAIARAVEDGCRASRAAGVGWIGDVAGSEAAVDARARAGGEAHVPGVSWLEVFGIDSRAAVGAEAAAERLAALRARHARVADLRIDLQPHAPYSAGLPLYERAAELGAPATHLAETLDEARFVRSADGAFRELLTEMRGGDDPALAGIGASPVRALEAVLAKAPWVLAHLNHVDDDDLDLLARCREVSVAYCPIASEYFGHRGHRYRDMLARGINVCLGTDSLLCQPPDEPQPHGILAACRRLFARDGTAPDVLLAMATVRGARALRLEPRAATLAPGAAARLAAVPFDPADPRDPWLQVLGSDAPARAIG